MKITINYGEQAYLEAGLKQLAKACNLFLNDIYNDGKIFRDMIIPEEIINSLNGYSPLCSNATPTRGIYNHFSTYELARSNEGTWFLLNSAIRVPTSMPEADTADFHERFRRVLDNVRLDRHSMVLCRDRESEEYQKLSALAKEVNLHVATSEELIIENDRLFLVTESGRKDRIGTLYRTLSDAELDPTAFGGDSAVGIPNVMDIYRKGNLSIINAPGSEIANDLFLYYFLPRIIRYYLGEMPLLGIIPTYIPASRKDMRYIRENFEKLVFIDTRTSTRLSGIAGYSMTEAEKADILAVCKDEPTRYIAQEITDLQFHIDNTVTARDADISATIFMAEQPLVSMHKI